MKKALLIIFTALLGTGLLSYPYIANYIAEKNGTYAAETYASEVAGLSEEELQACWDKAVRYNENLSGSPAHDPFIEGSGMVMQDNYYQVLAVNEMMGSITIPNIDVELPVYHGTAEDTLYRGVGHLEGSSMPVGGSDTHVVLTGHTGLPNAKLFTDLVELAQGDTFYLHILEETLAYEIDSIKVVEPNDTQDLRRIEEQDYCTLITCTPYGVNSHRLLVRGKRTAYREAEEAEAAKQRGSWTKEEKILIFAAAVTALVMLVLIIIAAVVSNKQTKKAAKSQNIYLDSSDVSQNIKGQKQDEKERFWWEED